MKMKIEEMWHKGWGLIASLGPIVQFGGDLTQLFSYIPWTPVPSFPQNPLLDSQHFTVNFLALIEQ